MTDRQRHKADVQAYLAAQSALEDDKRKEKIRYAETASHYVQRLIATFVISVLMIPVLLWVFGTLITTPCINNFYNQMPIYADAEWESSTTNFWNWLGLGSVSEVYRSPSPATDVQQWYDDQLAAQEAAYIDAKKRGVDIPKWEATVTVRQDTDGVIIEKVSTCFMELRQ